MRDRGRQIGGVPGAIVAGLMIALRDIYDPPPKRDDGIPMVEAPGEPHDVDRDGMALAADRHRRHRRRHGRRPGAARRRSGPAALGASAGSVAASPPLYRLVSACKSAETLTR